ncbi:hypothetical protein BASA50_007649 [Batrachochytrium salamandrivorans]|uniref:Uncharacterized protein n=1 Tax=Batrachochytrium salamandrivorans TaxID=1357716 RepID=A0ABQ8F6H3_9FUNG|nr:hypothetical protein BASA50_007649 [Batrachochytrium salamandrivorans]KAH6598317.1 hypothetical protein BASA61_002903 [Batrachochytrium salamandrivorans]KAH9267123.1 hypothetical protein BASA83_010151 [Batrachochytrium salamandrivorans]
MQFFYLFSFVAVVSNAAALPQPAELSEKYPNNVDTTLASSLSARSYQPGSNSHKDSATLTSLERRDSSEGSSGGNRGSGTPPPSTPDPNKTFGNTFSDSAVSSMNISSTIDNVGDGIFNLPEDGEKVAQKINGTLGEMLSGYIKRSTYVSAALDEWMGAEGTGILLTIQSILGETEFSEMLPAFLETFQGFIDNATAKEKEAAEATSNILKDTGTVIQNVEKIHVSFGLVFNNRISSFDLLKSLLGNSEAVETLLTYFFNMRTSLDKFLANQQRIHDEIMEKLRALPSE